MAAEAVLGGESWSMPLPLSALSRQNAGRVRAESSHSGGRDWAECRQSVGSAWALEAEPGQGSKDIPSLRLRASQGEELPCPGALIQCSPSLSIQPFTQHSSSSSRQPLIHAAPHPAHLFIHAAPHHPSIQLSPAFSTSPDPCSPSSIPLTGSDLESRFRPRPHLPVPLMHRAGAGCCRWGHQPRALAVGQHIPAPRRRTPGLWGSRSEPARRTRWHIPLETGVVQWGPASPELPGEAAWKQRGPR